MDADEIPSNEIELYFEKYDFFSWLPKWICSSFISIIKKNERCRGPPDRNNVPIVINLVLLNNKQNFFVMK